MPRPGRAGDGIGDYVWYDRGPRHSMLGLLAVAVII